MFCRKLRKQTQFYFPVSSQAPTHVTTVYKKGDLLDYNNNRLLAVSSCVYRLYSNVVRELMTDWNKAKGKVPGVQFGLYADRNTV